jgi:hypothetical protein
MMGGLLRAIMAYQASKYHYINLNNCETVFITIKNHGTGSDIFE